MQTLTSITDLTERVLATLQDLGAQRRVVVGLVGEPGSGKSTVAQALAAASAAQSSDAEAQRLRQALVSLSPREREVLDELIRGHYNKNIADHLGITPRTVEFHRANIFEKMGVGSAIELAHKLGRLRLVI